MTTRDQTVRLNTAKFFHDIGYEPHPAQWEIHNSKASRRVLACGARFGKSLAAAAEGLAAAMEPRDRCCGWVVTPCSSPAWPGPHTTG